MVRQPEGSVQGVSLSSYHPGQVYDIDPSLADYLIAEGYALAEMRVTVTQNLSFRDRRRAVTQIIEDYRAGKRSR
jgi:hypothetical protein